MNKYDNQLLGMSSLGCVRIENMKEKFEEKIEGLRILCFWGTPKLERFHK